MSHGLGRDGWPSDATVIKSRDVEIEELRKELASSQAREQQLWEALKWEREFQKDQGHDVSVFGGSVLTLPQDTSALEAMIAKSSEVMRERCIRELFGRYTPVDTARILSEEIRALSGVTLEDLK